MPKHIVELFEVVDVDHHKRDRQVLFYTVCNFARECFLHGVAIGEARQCIGLREFVRCIDHFPKHGLMNRK